jgi:hypothetical protein
MLPFLSTFAALKASEPEIKRPVDLVELSPEEQKRVPDFSTPEINLPPIPQAPDQKQNSFSLDPIPNQSAIEPPSNPSFFAPPPLPSIIPYIPPPPPRFSFNFNDTPAANPPAAIPSPSSQPTTPAKPAETPGSNQSTSPSVPPNAANSPQANQTPSQQATAPTEQPNQQAPQRTLDDIRRDLVARQRDLRQQYAERQEMQRLLTYNATGTSRGDADVTFGDWFYKELGGKSLDELKQERIAATYPKEACALKQDRQAVVGIVVDGGDRLVGQPRLIQSSGFPLFNQAALAAVADHKFDNPGDANQPYLVTVKFVYNADECPAETSQPTVPDPPAPASPPAG